MSMRFDFNVIAPLLPSRYSFSFVPGHGVFFFFSGFQQLPVDYCSAASCDFDVLAGDEHMSFYCPILILFFFNLNLFILIRG